MVNIFVSHSCPRKSAKALDNKRLSRLCYEAYEVLSSVVRKLNIPELKLIQKKVYQAPVAHFNHPVVKWVIQDRLHFEWTLLHAEALNEEYQVRYKKLEPCKPHETMNALLRKALKYIPSGKYDHDDVKRIDFEGFFNYNQFRSVHSDKHEGKVVLPDHINVVTRYRLYLLHKWLYLDARDVQWPSHAPVWAYNPLYREWLKKHFGKFKNKAQMLNRKSGAFVLAVHNGNSKNLRCDLIGKVVADKLEGNLIVEQESFRHVVNTTVLSDNKRHCYYVSRQWNNSIPLVACTFNPLMEPHDSIMLARLETLARNLSLGGIILVNICPVRDDYVHAIKQRHFERNNLAVKIVMSQIVARWREKTKTVLAYGDGPLEVEGGKEAEQIVTDTCDRYSTLLYLKLGKRGYPLHVDDVSEKLLPERYLPW